jgi:hypothetical protein
MTGINDQSSGERKQGDRQVFATAIRLIASSVRAFGAGLSKQIQSGMLTMAERQRSGSQLIESYWNHTWQDRG